MRSILFRGKAVDSGDWIEGDLKTLRQYKDMHHAGIVLKGNSEKDSVGFVYVLEDTVGQYTGSQDSGLSKIFEDDILRLDIKGTQRNGLIVFCKGSFFIAVDFYYDPNRVKWPVGTLLSSETDVWNNCDNCKIIGNIHDNHELMSEQKK